MEKVEKRGMKVCAGSFAPLVEGIGGVVHGHLLERSENKQVITRE